MEQNLDKQFQRWIKVMRLGAIFGCHQLPNRSFFYKGYQFPVCARCTGIFFGQLLGICSYFLSLRPHYWICVGLIVPLIIDGLIQLAHIKESTNLRRTITGLMCGYGYSILLIYFIIWLVQILIK